MKFQNENFLYGFQNEISKSKLEMKIQNEIRNEISNWKFLSLSYFLYIL